MTGANAIRAAHGLPASGLAMHEATHVVAARRLGLTVACAVISRGEGWTLIPHDGSADDIRRAAVATAAAVVFDRKLGGDETRHADDLHRVNELCGQYRAAAGHDMPDPFAAAEPFFRCPLFARDVLAVAARLDAAGEIGRAAIEALVAGPTATEPGSVI